MKRFKVTSYAERELSKFLETVNRPAPLKPEIVEAESHEEAARICKARKELFLGEPVVIVSTGIIE